MRISGEQRLLQVLVTLAGGVPVSAGFMGAVTGGAFFHLAGDATAKSHGAYLSGLLLGLGLGFWSCVPELERQSSRFALLCLIVMTGGLARAWIVASLGGGGPTVWLALAMELLVTPALFLWQRRIAAAIVS